MLLDLRRPATIMFTLRFAGSMFLALATMNIASAATMVVGGPGDPGNGECPSFGCGVQFQQIYDASLFPSAISITGLTFYNQNWSPGSIASANYTIHLSTTSTAIDGMSLAFADNVGPNNTLFFGGALGGLIGPSNEFTITGTPFAYDPTQGNLIISITSDGPGDLDTVFLDFASSNPSNLFTRSFSFGSGPEADTITPNEGLVTGFVYATGTEVPEPGSAWLMLGGAAALIGLARKRIR